MPGRQRLPQLALRALDFDDARLDVDLDALRDRDWSSFRFETCWILLLCSMLIADSDSFSTAAAAAMQKLIHHTLQSTSPPTPAFDGFRVRS